MKRLRESTERQAQRIVADQSLDAAMPWTHSRKSSDAWQASRPQTPAQEQAFLPPSDVYAKATWGSDAFSRAQSVDCRRCPFCFRLLTARRAGLRGLRVARSL